MSFLQTLEDMKKSGVPASWRPLIQKDYVYAVSCWFYALIYLFWNDPELIARKLPIMNHLGLCQLAPYYWFLQAWVSFWSDYLELARPSWSHFVDTVFAVLGSYLYLYVALFERVLDLFSGFCGIMGVVHAYFAFAMSRYYRRVEPNPKKYAQWHIQWHISFPLWTSLLGWNQQRLPDPEIPWYPHPLYSYWIPMLTCLFLVWKTRSTAVGEKIENTIEIGKGKSNTNKNNTLCSAADNDITPRTCSVKSSDSTTCSTCTEVDDEEGKKK
ncbi:unnamed protein product [Amoebophrya sp. A120]|nr:unnamed protein product [Amoebophrya sp. A120]CAD7960962.1 unnamed protein product [Amoebophrya sp. A120]|eukprot:GSA120T00025208001.1